MFNQQSMSAFASLSRKSRPKVHGGILYVSTDPVRFALVQGRHTGKWSFPKGHPQDGEAPITTALREIEEETGIQSLPTPSMTYRIGYGSYFAFPLQTTIPLVPIDHGEIMNVAWVTLDEMEQMQLNIDVNQFRRQSWRYDMNKPHYEVCNKPIGGKPLYETVRPVSPVGA